eukprot:CAMPEP_0195514774 /NCGR_PEP_ID=MMETSP0794_2-20130614/6057_1 /TAXON_ID=515487 /ORGANISM="Stephanopyxis turris, Strain CCMP 815" /LENGTH=298 /DNA_ID=CAMNT_0040643089 /DNA_START=31 /DNA_END=924 /DNA_ORIENTATION=+
MRIPYFTSSTTTFSSPMSSIQGHRVAAVTGANKGIGFYIALQLASSGLFRNIILGCRDPDRGQAAVREITNQLVGGMDTPIPEISYLPLEVGNSSSHSDFKQKIEKNFGKLDVLVNNAATAFKGSDPTPFQDQTKPTLDINFRGTIDLTCELLPLIRKGSDARIVNVASMAGRLNQIKSKELRDQFSSSDLTLSELRNLVNDFENDVRSGVHSKKGWGSSNYGMSKLALIAATKVMAREEEGAGVKVNCLCPGYCDTDMTSHLGTKSAADGAKTATLLATMENCPTGAYFTEMQPGVW